MRIFFFSGEGEALIFGSRIYIFFFGGGGRLLSEALTIFFGGGVDFCLNLTIPVPPPLPISLGAELILKISHLTRNTVRTLKKP